LFRITAREGKYVFVFALFTAIFAVVPLPFEQTGTVPHSLLICGALLAGLCLPPKLAFFSQLIYLGLGTVGIPIFPGFTGGAYALVRGSGGFLIALWAVAWVPAILKKLFKIKSFWILLITVIPALAVYYLFGVTQLFAFGRIPFEAAIRTGLLDMLPFDLAKAAIAAVGAFLVKRFGNEDLYSLDR